MDINSQIRKVVKQQISEGQYTQADLARSLGVTQAYVSMLLNDEHRGKVNADYQKVLDYLGLRLALKPVEVYLSNPTSRVKIKVHNGRR